MGHCHFLFNSHQCVFSIEIQCFHHASIVNQNFVYKTGVNDRMRDVDERTASANREFHYLNDLHT